MFINLIFDFFINLRNIFLKKNSIKIGDFGLAKLNSVNKSLFSEMTGTELYMSHNIWDYNYSYNSDVW